MHRKTLVAIAALGAFSPFLAKAQSATDLAAFKGLSPLAVLSSTPQGQAALTANYKITGGIQTGAIKQPTLLPFPQQQQLALQDAFSTVRNLAQLADGLGTTLGTAYQARAHYIDRTKATDLSPAVADVIAYAIAITGENSASAKSFFANATTNGKTPVSPEALAILKEIGGATDVFGKSYGLLAGASGADIYGNSRPFQTEPGISPIAGPDYFNAPSDNRADHHGPIGDLSNSPAYPSGHTTYGYTGGVILALLVPDRYQQMITRAAEYGNDRIILGAHYAMDVIGGRTLAIYDLAHLLADDPPYVGRSSKAAPTINDFPAAIKHAREDLATALQAACGKSIRDCSREDTSRLSKPAANEAFYNATQTYDLPVVYSQNTKGTESVGKLAPEAGYLLTVAFPSLSLEQADQILTETEGPGGGFLDNGSSFGVYSRLNLYAAAGKAAKLASRPSSHTQRDKTPSPKVTPAN